LNPLRSGEFCVPKNALDDLYLRILSLQTPKDSQQHLLELLQALILAKRQRGYMSGRGKRGIAVEAAIRKAVECCPQRVFFVKTQGKFDLIDHSLRSFLLDPGRSGRFCFAEGKIPDASILWP